MNQPKQPSLNEGTHPENFEFFKSSNEEFSRGHQHLRAWRRCHRLHSVVTNDVYVYRLWQFLAAWHSFHLIETYSSLSFFCITALSCGYSASTKCWEVAEPWKKPFYFPAKQSTFQSLSWKILASHLSPEPIRTLGGLLWLRFCQLFAGLSCQKILSVRVGTALSNCRQPKKELSEHSNRKVVWIKYNVIYLPQY